jgi:autotransporter-associated beta strand protein
MASFRRGSRRYPSRVLALASVVAALAAAPKASATFSYYWLGGDYDNWSASNWDSIIGGFLNDNSYDNELNFTTSDTNRLVTNDMGSVTLQSLNFANSDWKVNGDTLEFESGLIKVQPSSPHVTIYNSVTVTNTFIKTNTLNLDAEASSVLDIAGSLYGDGSIIKTGSGTVVLSHWKNNYQGGTTVDGGHLVTSSTQGNYNVINGNLDFNIVDGNDGTVTGNLFGGGNLTKSGDGLLVISGNTGYTGMTTVNEGRLRMNNPWSSSGYDLEGGNLEFQTSTSGTYAGSIRGTGIFTKSGSGTLTLTSTANSVSNGVFVTGGRLIESVAMGNASSYALSNDAALEIRTDDANQAFFASISGQGSFTKSGTGTLNMLSENTYTGGTTILAGRLIDPNPHGSVYLDLSALEFRTSTDQSYSGGIFGGGSLTKSGIGTLTLDHDYTGSPIPAWQGSTTVEEGRLVDLRPHGNYVTNSELEFANADDISFETAVAVGPSTPNFISGTGNFTKSGQGALLLLAPNGYAGSTTISGGTIFSLVNNALPTSTALRVGDGATFGTANSVSQKVAALFGSGNLVLGGTFTVDGPDSSSFGGVISGNAPLSKAGTGTLILNGVNTYSGGTTVDGGILVARYPNGSYVTNAELDFRNLTDIAYGKVVSGTGNFTKSGNGVLTLTGRSTHAGTTTVAAGTLIEGVDDALSTVSSLTVASGATLDVNGHRQTVSGLTGSGKLKLTGSNADFEVHNADVDTFDGVISGSGHFTKGGGGTLTLTGKNSYTGGTSVTGGALVVTRPNGDYAVDSSLEAQISTTQNLTGAISGSGLVIKSGAGTLYLTGANTYTGGTKVSSGRLIDLNPHGAYSLNTGSVLELRAVAAQSFSGVVTGPGSLDKNGLGTLTLTGKNNYTGGTTVSAGRLIDQNPHGDYVVNTALEFANTANANLSGMISGTGSLTKSGVGSLTLSGTDSHTGGTTVAAGTLRVTGSLGGGLTVASGATLDNATPFGLTFGSATLQGTVRTSNVTHFTGPVSGAGNFTGSGMVDFQGGYSPGNSPASVTFAGGLTLAATNTLTMELGGTTLGSGYDHLAVTGLTTLGGKLTVTSINGFSPTFGQSFDLFDFSSSNGAFASLSLPTLSRGLAWDTTRLYADGTISVHTQAVPEPASLAALTLGAFALLKRRRK